MAWNITERFPSWGETGSFPAAGFFYEGGDQVNEKHLDALWNGINGFEEDVQAALADIDSDADGVVDKADTLATAATIDGDLSATDGETIWDESASYIPQGRLQNDSIDAGAGDGLTGGGLTALGGSFTFNIEPNDFAGTNLQDDGADNLEVVQGPNSGLDADTLDGNEGSYFATSTEVDNESIPAGGIVMWSGTVTNIPSGWALCDGNNGTPDLRDRFVTGAGGQYSAGATGGEDEHVLTEDEMPSHTHDYIDQNDNNTQAGGGGSVEDYNFTNQTGSTGGDLPHENRPPYHALAYIMKL